MKQVTIATRGRRYDTDRPQCLCCCREVAPVEEVDEREDPQHDERDEDQTVSGTTARRSLVLLAELRSIVDGSVQPPPIPADRYINGSEIMRLRGFRARLRGGSESNDAEPARLPERPIGRYVLALVLIAVLAVLSTFTTYRALSAQEKDATVLEYGLRQGYLATRVADLVGQVVDGVSEPLHDELVASTGEIVQIHDVLHGRRPRAWHSRSRDTAVGDLLDEAGVALEGFLAVTDQAVAAIDRQGRAPTIIVEGLNEAAGQYGLAMQRVVSSYLRVSGEQVVALEQTEYFLLAATLVLLVLEGLFLFRPAVRNLKQSWTENTEAHRFERELDQQRLSYLARYDALDRAHQPDVVLRSARKRGGQGTTRRLGGRPHVPRPRRIQGCQRSARPCGRGCAPPTGR